MTSALSVASCELDSNIHAALSVLSNIRAGKKGFNAISDANLVCRKLAAVHPLLFLRYDFSTKTICRFVWFTGVLCALKIQQLHKTAIRKFMDMICSEIHIFITLWYKHHLYYRHLSALTSTLSGRCHLAFGEIVHQNYLLLHTCVLGLVELLQPHIFMHKDFPALINSYFTLYKVISVLSSPK